jgi:serine/arginine repetitive matrix protein 1
MRKVNLQVIRPWVAKKVVELVGFEDEVVIEYAMGLMEDDKSPVCLLCLSYGVFSVRLC